MIFLPVSLDFVIFSSSDGFRMVSPWISNPWRHFMPWDGSRSIRGWNFTQNSNFIKDVTGRNKNYQKYQPWPYNEFIIPPSSGALALHALIISLKPSGKIVKVQNERTEFSHNVKFRSKLFNSSFNFDLKTSCALPPYYSLELNLISSTSHSNLFLSPGSRILMICCVSRAKMHIWSRKIDESWSVCVFFLIFWFSQFSMVLKWF